MYRSLEVYGRWPGKQECIIVKLLTKKDGTSRHILLFRCLQRVWAEARPVYATAWEADKASGVRFNKSPGRDITDELYRQGRKACVRSGSCHAIETLHDINNACENIDRRRLWLAAEKRHYPKWLLRVSLRSYGSREEYWGKATSPAGAYGIGAGSAFAVQELKLYLKDVVDSVKVDKGYSLAVVVHVDDVCIEVAGND
jgi:hypothetical protein